MNISLESGLGCIYASLCCAVLSSKLVDTSGICDNLVLTVGRAASAGATGAVFGASATQVTAEQQAERFRNGVNPYVPPPRIQTPLSNLDVKVTDAERPSAMRTGNRITLARMSHQRSHGTDPRVASNFGYLNAVGGNGLSDREMNMATDVAQMKDRKSNV